MHYRVKIEGRKYGYSGYSSKLALEWFSVAIANNKTTTLLISQGVHQKYSVAREFIALSL